MATAKRKVINANIILYGPPQSGKSSNIQFIFRKLKPSQRGQIQSLSQDGYPRVAYEFLPIELGELKGYDTNLYIYTSPSHDDGLETRLNLLNEAAGVVFIADSGTHRLDDNIESLTNLKEELRYWNIDYDTFPVVFQYNKRDLPNVLGRDELEAQLNPEGKESFEAIASLGQGVRDTFALISKMAVRRVRLKLSGDDRDSGEISGEMRVPPSDALPPRTVALPKASRPPSEVTLDVAPPLRDDTGSVARDDSDADDLEVDDEERRSEHGVALKKSPPAAAPDFDFDPPTTIGSSVNRDSRNIPAASASVATAHAPAGESTEARADAEKRTKRKRGKRSDSDSPPSLPDTSVAPVSASADEDGEIESFTRDDFLKTSIRFSPADQAAMVEATEPTETLEAGDESDDEDNAASAVSSFHENESSSLDTISLPESAAATPISLAPMDGEINIQTYAADDEDEDDDAPLIRLGSRARIEEELPLEDEMILDDVGPVELDQSALDIGPDDRMADLEPISEHDLTEQEDSLVGAAPLRLASTASFENLDTEDTGDGPEVMDWVLPQGLPMVVIPDAMAAPAKQSSESPALLDDEADEIIDSGRFAATFDASTRDPGALFSVDETGSTSDRQAGDLWDDAFDQVQVVVESPTPPTEPSVVEFQQPTFNWDPDASDASLSALELAVSGDAPRLADVALSAHNDLHGMVPEEHESSGVFEAIVEIPSEPPSPSTLQVAPAATPVNGASNEDLRPRRAIVTDWGDAIQVDAHTLRLPVTVRLPDGGALIELAVTLNVEMLVQGLRDSAQ